MNVSTLDAVVEQAVHAPGEGLSQFRAILGPFSLYHGLALSVAYSPELASRIVKKNGGNVQVLWARIPQSVFLERVRASLSDLQAELNCSKEELADKGFSVRAAIEYIQYLRGQAVVTPGRDPCNFALGCPLNDGDNDQGLVTIHSDHLLAASLGGTETQSMCGYHNRIKQDFPLFDTVTLKNLFLKSRGAF